MVLILLTSLIVALTGSVVGKTKSDVQTLHPLPALSAIVAYNGYVVWSELDPGTGSWYLLDWHSGITSRLPVPPRSVPFDADVGPDAAGKPVAVYSRCRKEPIGQGGLALYSDWMTASGCDLYEIGLTGGSERRLDGISSRRASETTPSVWRGSIIFARHMPKAHAARIYLRRRGSRQLLRLPGGTLSHCLLRGCRSEPRPRAGVDAIDLGPRSVAFLWRLMNGNVVGTDVAWELRSDALHGKGGVLAASGYVGGACEFDLPLSPNAAPRGALFLERIGTCTTKSTRIVLFDRRNRTRREAQPASGFAYAAAGGGRAIVWVSGPRPEAPAPQGSDPCRSRLDACELVRSSNLPFIPKHRGKARPPTL
jgi:hypothetical protein